MRKAKCTLTKNENFTLDLLNSCFVSIHVVVRLTHAYQDFVADNDNAIFIPMYIKASMPEKRFPYVARAEEQVVH